MNLIKGIFGFGGSAADKLVDSVKAKGGFYMMKDGKRDILFNDANISFEKNKEKVGYKFAVHIQTKEEIKPNQYFLPIHEDMQLKTFSTHKNKQPKVCFEWFLEATEQGALCDVVGLIVDPNQATDLEQGFGHTIKQTFDKDSKASHQSFITHVTGLPVYKKAESNISSSAYASRMSELNDVLLKQANQQNTKLAFTGRLNYINGMQFKEINSSIVFSIKQKEQFNFSIYIFTDKGYKLLQKPITQDMTYEVNLQYSYIKWLDFTEGSKIVQVVFDKYDVVRDVKFCIHQCIYELNTKRRMNDAFKVDEQQYLKQTMDQKYIPINPKIIQTYDKVNKISFAPQQNDDIIDNHKKVLEKYRDRRAMVQGKTAGCTIVSLANMLDLMVIDQDNKLKKVQSIQLINKDKKQVIPQKMLMQDGDTKMLIQSQDDSLYYFDMNQNKIIQEYNPSDKDHGIKDVVPEKKLAELGSFKTFLGVSDNGIYRIDPRIPKTGVAEKHIYKGDKYQFSRIVTTSDGNYAVGSQDGTIRLYNNKVNNKTKATNKFPGLQRVMHLDTTKDGKWILATFPTHLILLPTDFQQTNLYQRTVQIAERNKPIKLKIKIEHLELCKSEDKKMIPAHFDESANNLQKFIVSGFGEYVAVWNFGKVLKGYKEYTFKKEQDEVNEAQFKFDDPNKLLLNTHTRVSMEKTNYQ